MELLYLSRKDVEATGIGMSEVIAAVAEGFRQKGLGRTEMPAKMGIHPNSDGFIHAMPAYVKGIEVAGMKWVSAYPSNAAKGLPYISGLLILNDGESGLPVAVMDCSWITAMRTGASVGIAARHLADPDSRVVGILGCGVQNRTALMALADVLPRINEVRCRDIVPAAALRYTEEMGRLFPGFRFAVADSEAEMVDGADVVVTAIPITRGTLPPLDAGMLKPGGLAVALDYDSAWTSTAMKQCLFYSDDVEQLLATQQRGIYFSGIPKQIHGDLGEIAIGSKRGRQSCDERYFCMNLGIAIEDMVTARIVHQEAGRRGIGVKLTL